MGRAWRLDLVWPPGAAVSALAVGARCGTCGQRGSPPSEGTGDRLSGTPKAPRGPGRRMGCPREYAGDLPKGWFGQPSPPGSAQSDDGARGTCGRNAAALARERADTRRTAPVPPPLCAGRGDWPGGLARNRGPGRLTVAFRAPSAHPGASSRRTRGKAPVGTDQLPPGTGR